MSEVAGSPWTIPNPSQCDDEYQTQLRALLHDLHRRWRDAALQQCR
jgi:hypothetical protein